LFGNVAGGWTVNVYVRDILLALSLIATPLIFVTLLFHGLTKDRHHHHDDEPKNDHREREPKAPSDRGPGVTPKSV
jgi:hypothetical protein